VKCRWGLLLLLYAVVVIGCTLLVRGHSALEWVQLLVPSGRLHDWLIYRLHHHNPVTFTRLLNLADSLFNLLLFFPLGLCLFGALQRPFSGRIQTLLLLALSVGLLLSLGIETLQMFIPMRVPEIADVIANVGGMVLGCYWPYFWQRLIHHAPA
jgi:VanZ family protein